jgi:hypothetical protein
MKSQQLNLPCHEFAIVVSDLAPLCRRVLEKPLSREGSNFVKADDYVYQR